MRTNYCRYVDRRVREKLPKDFKLTVPCKHKLVRFLGEGTHWIFCAMSLWKETILNHMRKNALDKIFTVGDPEGAIYNIVSHHLREELPSHSETPVWCCPRNSLETVLVRGPLGVMMDPCTIDYDEREFIQHMSSDKVTFTKRGLYVIADDMERTVNLPEECLILKR